MARTKPTNTTLKKSGSGTEKKNISKTSSAPKQTGSERKTMILQVDEATRGLMNEIKNGITEEIGNTDYSGVLRTIRDNVEGISAKLDDFIPEISSAKAMAEKAADGSETVEARLGKLEKDIRKVSDEQKQINEKLDRILEFIETEG